MPRTPATVDAHKPQGRNEPAKAKGKARHHRALSDNQKTRGKRVCNSHQGKAGKSVQGNARRHHAAGMDFLPTSTRRDGKGPARGRSVRQSPKAAIQNQASSGQGWIRDTKGEIFGACEEAWTLDLGAVRVSVFTTVAAPREWRAKVHGSGFYVTNLRGAYATMKGAQTWAVRAAIEIMQDSVMRGFDQLFVLERSSLTPRRP